MSKSKIIVTGPVIREIENRMRRLGMNQTQLSTDSGLSSAMISRLLSGQVKGITSDTLKGLAKGLRTDHVGLENSLRLFEEGLLAHDEGKPVLRQTDLTRLPSAGTVFCGRHKELDQLNDAWKNDSTHVIAIIAEGGAGKTSLAARWNAEMAHEDYRGAQRVFAYSFYKDDSQQDQDSSQPTTETFLDTALKWFGVAVTGPPQDKANLLAETIHRYKTLLILDGLEVLQHKEPDKFGRLKDAPLRSLLIKLATYIDGLCLLTSRQPITDLNDYQDKTYREIKLEGLLPSEGADLLDRILNKRVVSLIQPDLTTDDEFPDDEFPDDELPAAKSELEKQAEDSNRRYVLEQIVKELSGHGLALALYATYLRDVLGGDLSKRKQIGSLLDEPSGGAHARRVIESYKNYFEKNHNNSTRIAPEIAAMYLISLFPGKVSMKMVDLLRRQEIPGLTDDVLDLSDLNWRLLLTQLDRSWLIRYARPADRPGAELIDLHPLIRDFFADEFKKKMPDVWEEANFELYKSYDQRRLNEMRRDQKLEQVSKEGKWTTKALLLALRGVYHAAKANKFEKAYDLYRCTRFISEHSHPPPRSGYGADRAVLAMFFETPWSQPIGKLKPDQKAWLMQEAGWTLMALGEMSAAREPVELSLKMTERWINQPDANFSDPLFQGMKIPKEAARRAGILSRILQSLGHLKLALDTAYKGLTYALQADDSYQKVTLQSQVATVLHQMGRRKEAFEAFKQAIAFQEIRPNVKCKKLQRELAFYYLELLYERGDYQGILDHLDHLKELDEKFKQLDDKKGLLREHERTLALARYDLVRGMAHYGLEDFAQALDEVEAGLVGIRKASIRWMLPVGLLMKELCMRKMGATVEERCEVITKAYEIAKECDLALAEIDCLIAFGHHDLDKRDEDGADNNIVQARRRIKVTGYERQTRYLDELSNRLNKERESNSHK